MGQGADHGVVNALDRQLDLQAVAQHGAVKVAAVLPDGHHLGVVEQILQALGHRLVGGQVPDLFRLIADRPGEQHDLDALGIFVRAVVDRRFAEGFEVAE